VNKKINPVLSLVIILAAIGIAFGVVWTLAGQKEPPLPSSMGAAMQATGTGPQAQPPGRGGNRANAPGRPNAPAGNRGDR